MPVSIPVGARTDHSSFKSVADEIDSYFTEVGEKVGRNFSKELADGMASSEKDIQRSAEKVVKSYDKAADAIGRVRTEQARLDELQKSGARDDQIVRQVERVESARRKESAAIRQTVKDLEDYTDQAQKATSAVQGIASASQGAGAAAGQGFGSGFMAGANRNSLIRYFSDLWMDIQTSGSASGVLIGRAVGAGVTTGLVATAAGAAAVIGGIGYTLTKGFQRLQGIDQAQFKLKALGHSGAEVSAIMKDAEASVKGTAFALDEAVGAAASAVAAGIKPGEDLSSYLTTIGDTAAVAGTSFDEMASIFNKVTGNTKAQTGELQQLADRGIPIFTWLQDAYKMTGAELSKMVSKSGIDAATFRNVIAANIGGAAQEMGQSFSGAMDNLQAAIARVGAAALGAPFESAAGAIEALTGKLDSMTAWMTANQDKIIGFWTKIAEGATFAVGVIESSTYVITQSLSWIVNAFGDAMGAVMKGQSFLKRMVGQTADADALSQEADAWFGLADGINAFKDATWGAMQGTADFMGDIKQWGDRAQDAAKLNQLLAGATATVRDDHTVAVDLADGPDGPRDALKEAGFDTIAT
ncbi:tape measure protein, partial [Mycobacterium sp. 1274756.6]|uniref:tape measure protein n=1 Tax=Mycobacterium sp. 1274756.6 TaxID=1834076 RepID=UPI000AF26207